MKHPRHRSSAGLAWTLAVALGAACAAPSNAPRTSTAPRDLTPAVARAPRSLAPASAPLARPRTVDLASGALTFDALLATALGESPDLAMTAARVERAEAQLRAAKAATWPTVGVEASYLRADAPSMYLFKTIDAGRFSPSTDFNDPGAFGNWEAAIGVQYNLYDGGRDGLREGLAADEREAARQGGYAVENALVAALVNGWYGVRAAEEQARTAEAAITTVDAQLAEARARYELGSGLETDVLSLEVRRAESEELLLRAQNGRRLGLAALAQLAGLEGAGELELVGAGPRRADAPTSLDEALDAAETARPELAQARRRVNQAERGVRMARSGYLPRADVFARGWRDAPELDFDDSRDNWALGVSLSWSLFDGTRGAGVDGARAALTEAQRGLQKARLGIQLDVRAAWLALEDAGARLAVAEQAETTAARNLDLVRAQFEGGAATVTRYLESEWMQTQARTRATNARFDLERAHADLARATGRFRAAGPTQDN
ncbi:MAG: TolC family protein [Planctomycetes bacterium]|nr:TolC family protein [Planctomycetota bacterium]